MGHHVNDKKYFVKITSGKSQCLAKTVYYKRDLTFQIVVKWRWYFEYREALYKISNPKYYTCLEIGSYDYIPSEIEKATKLKNDIIGKKATITKYQNRLTNFERNWNSLFSIDDYSPYIEAKKKIEVLKTELQELTKQ